MPTLLPQVSLVRHGETAWAVSGRHTGRSDIDLTPRGEDAARLLAGRLKEIPANVVWSSPSLRARRTCELAGFASGSVVKPDLQEWDYGQYEGVTTKEIQQTTPGWRLFRDGAPGGEDVNQVGERADRIIAEIRESGQSVLIFSSSHFLRVLAARWLGLPSARGESFILGTASLSILGYEHDLQEPVIRAWNT
jgi:probable phosphoglycerate mutase